MKPIKLLTISVMAILLSGCLNEKNVSYTTMDNYFQNTTQIITGINGCYNPLRTIIQRRDFWEMTDVATDLLYMSSSTVYNANCDVSPARPGCAAPVWQYGYTGVKNTNDMTYAIDAAVKNGYITKEEAAPLHAETAVLRALYYYILTCTFGDVPFYTEMVTEQNREKIATLPRMSARDTRDYCIAEIHEWIVEKRALPMVRTYEGTEHRAGAAVGLMIAAKMCMWNERWDDAILFIEELESIYGHYADSPDTFGVDYPLTDVPFSKRYVRESIFEMANIVKDYGIQTSSMLASSSLPARTSKALVENDAAGSEEEDDEIYDEEDGEQLDDNSGFDCYAGICIPELGVSAKPAASVRPNTYLYSRLLPYSSKDLRTGEYSNGATTPRGGSGTLAWRWVGYDPTDEDRTSPSVFFFWSSGSSKSRISGSKKPWMGNKFWAFNMHYTKDPNNYKFFRFADALLMKAEVYLHKKEYDKSCKYLNITRTRAGLDPLTFASVYSESEALMEEIRMERAKELVGEFQRKFDLVRWGIWYERTIMYNEGQYISGFIRPCHRYWPIPADQVAYSGNALDNKEYSE